MAFQIMFSSLFLLLPLHPPSSSMTSGIAFNFYMYLPLDYLIVQRYVICSSFTYCSPEKIFLLTGVTQKSVLSLKLMRGEKGMRRRGKIWERKWKAEGKPGKMEEHERPSTRSDSKPRFWNKWHIFLKGLLGDNILSKGCQPSFSTLIIHVLLFQDIYHCPESQ